ncbi:MAG: hypothetical protein BRC48_15325 [Cyanobacteria bacterium QS_9_48_30]|nr:MAG: hypothetical protein BRC48_15325 [Cyanobacteria bacterium QS_9_48_30]
MAFLLDPNQLTKIEIPFKDRLKLLGPLLWLALQQEGKSLFRTDKESCQNTISRRNLDLANYLRNGPYNPEKAGLASRKMLYYLSKQNLIKTDRLHIAIGGGLLEKRVHLYGNNYFKNYAVFHSRHKTEATFSRMEKRKYGCSIAKTPSLRGSQSFTQQASSVHTWSATAILMSATNA